MKIVKEIDEELAGVARAHGNGDVTLHASDVERSSELSLLAGEGGNVTSSASGAL